MQSSKGHQCRNVKPPTSTPQAKGRNVVLLKSTIKPPSKPCQSLQMQQTTKWSKPSKTSTKHHLQVQQCPTSINQELAHHSPSPPKSSNQCKPTSQALAHHILIKANTLQVTNQQETPPCIAKSLQDINQRSKASKNIAKSPRVNQELVHHNPSLTKPPSTSAVNPQLSSSILEHVRSANSLSNSVSLTSKAQI